MLNEIFSTFDTHTSPKVPENYVWNKSLIINIKSCMYKETHGEIKGAIDGKVLLGGGTRSIVGFAAAFWQIWFSFEFCQFGKERLGSIPQARQQRRLSKDFRQHHTIVQYRF